MKKLLLLSLISLFTYSYAKNNEAKQVKVMEELSSEKKQVLISNLYQLYNTSIGTNKSKIDQAVAILQANSIEPNKALDFFYICYKKQNFADGGFNLLMQQKKKS